MTPTFANNATRVRGFTLLELMVGLTIMGMMLLAGLPSFTTFLRNAEIRSTSESISNGLRLARTEATRLNRPVSFTLAGSANPGWAINIFNPVTGLLLQPPLQSYSRFEVGRSGQVVTAPASALAVTFNGLGRIDFAVTYRDAEPAADRRHLGDRRRGAHVARFRRRPAWREAVRSRPGVEVDDAPRCEGLLR